MLAVASGGSAAAASFALRLARESRASPHAVFPAASTPPPGPWDTLLTVDTTDPVALAAALATVLDDPACLAVVFDDDAAARETAGRLAVRCGLPCIGAVVAARERDGVLQVTRHAAAGTRTAILGIARTPALLIVDGQSVATESTSAASAREPRPLPVTTTESLLEFIDESRPGPWEMDVAEADVVVAGGRGVGGRDGFAMLAELAGLLGGTVAGTRVAVDAGWVPYPRQVGLTGKTIAPRLYIACGISGAIHHTLGMRNSGQVIAINTDERAPIFQVATVSVVADVHDVVPKLIHALKARKGAATPVRVAP
ncbi:MAG: hypothetical protein Kow0010_23930 [Dehalococcoidia bacterium]